MKCPTCNEEMKEGYVFLASGGGLFSASFLCWSKEEPTFWHIPKDRIKLLHYGLHKSMNKSVSKAYLCEKCHVVTFEYSSVEKLEEP